VPFTLLFVVRGEELLLERGVEVAKEAQGVDQKLVQEKKPVSARTKDLLNEWSRWNYARSLFPLAAALISLSTM
jgi:hypothetical protein